jgi:hypothetical protein
MTTTEDRTASTTEATDGSASVDAFVGAFASDLAAVLHSATVVLGDNSGSTR